MQKRIISAVLMMASSVAFADAVTSLSTGFDNSSGNYGGTTPTKVLYIPFTGQYLTENFTLKLTVPYIKVTSIGTNTVVRGLGRFRPPVTTTTSKTITQSGVGDVVGSAGFTLLESDYLNIDLVGNVKFGTADTTKNLSTGENDYSAQLDGFYSIYKTTLFATAGYKKIGAPMGITVNNIGFGTLGISHKIEDAGSIGIMFDAAQSTGEYSPGTSELTLFASTKMSSTSKIQFSLMKGFSDGSPQYGLGLMVSGSF
jgi:hypothetical protein